MIIKKIGKILKWLFIVFLLLLLLLVIVLKTPSIQSNLAQRATKFLSNKYQTSIEIDKIDLSNFPDISLKGIVIKDHHNYPFIKVKTLKSSLLNWKNIINNKLEINTIDINEIHFVLKTYLGEKNQNIVILTDKFKTKNKKNSPEKDFLLTANKINLTNSSFDYYNENSQKKPIVFYKKIHSNIHNFKILGSNIFAEIKNTSLVDNYKIKVTNLNTYFTYTNKQMLFKKTTIATKYSYIETDIAFNYSRKDLSDFNNKVEIESSITKANVSLNDLHLFYNELGKTDKINFTTNFKGTLNNFKLQNLKLTSQENAVVHGDLHFKNAVNQEKGFSVNANLDNLTSDYSQLKRLLPNLLGKTLPSSFALLGRFTLKGKSYITTKSVDAQLAINSDLGQSISDLKITNITDIDNAKYKGKIELIDFNLGAIIKDSLVSKLSMIADIDGKGFIKETLNTSIIGHISKHQYKGYTYSNIDINGVFKQQHFNGDMTVNDANIKMTFKGLADLSKTTNSFKFKVNVAYANFNKLNLFKRDSISVLKGKIDIDLKGNTIDNMIGKVNFKDASYVNQNNLYKFTNFDISSAFKDSIRTLKVNSKDIINGKIVGKFKFAQLPLLAKNSLGSIYSHYKPDSVSSGQFLSFNFKIHDKIIGVFFPEISLDNKTFIRGKINSDKEKFELTFRSPKVKAYGNLIEKIHLQIDNKNPLFNTLLSIDKLDSKKYKIADLNLVNVTINDTLFLRTDFVGGEKLTEKYNLSLYHTINTENKSVVGFKKSDIIFKNQKWLINPTNNKESKVVFDENFKNFNFKKLNIISNKQEFVFEGFIKDKRNKDLKLHFNNIILDKITPRIDSISLNGIVNGNINYKQINGKTIPKLNLIINNFVVNDIKQGDLSIQASADNTFKKYSFSSNLIQNNIKKLSAIGAINLTPKEPIIDASIQLNNLNLKALSPLGGNTITNIRALVKGEIELTGALKNPDMKGDLFVREAGLTFPYLNTDYKIKGNQKISLHNQTFELNQTTLIDTEKQTEGLLTGSISHTNFKEWFLNLKINTDNLLVLNTKENEDTPYYGTGFINGSGTIIGLTNGLIIDVIATTNPGTEFIVPLSDINTIEENKLINFVNNNNSQKDNGRPDEIIFNKKGVTLIFDLTVTPDALTQIVIDKATGSVLRGRGDAYLAIEINTNGKFEMFGTYVVDNGVYELKNIVNKTFKVKQGGKIFWNGSPFDAYLNIVAINKVRANPSVLLENIQSTRDIDINLITNITGNLYEPQMKFDIKMPKASSLVQSELAYKINDENKKMTQFFSLLSLGTFANVEEFDFANSGNSLLLGTLSERISSVISNFLRDDDDLIQVGVNLEIGDRNRLNNNLRNDDQVDITFKTKIYKKIILNGVVGVPIGANTQSSLIGEFEVELPLNKKENFRAKAYSKQNEVQFDILDSEGYTQGIGLSYQFNWNNGSEFLEKIGLKKSKEKREKKRLKKLSLKKRRDSLKKLKKEALINFID